MKHEWKKQEKALYGARQVPAIITVPVQRYIMIRGEGNPNAEDFSNRVEKSKLKTILRFSVEQEVKEPL